MLLLSFAFFIFCNISPSIWLGFSIFCLPIAELKAHPRCFVCLSPSFILNSTVMPLNCTALCSILVPSMNEPCSKIFSQVISATFSLLYYELSIQLSALNLSTSLTRNADLEYLQHKDWLLFFRSKGEENSKNF